MKPWLINHRRPRILNEKGTIVKNPSPKFPISVLASQLSLMMILVTFTSGIRLDAQSADFNSGNDTGWTHYSLPNLAGFSGSASFTFPPDGAGGQAYRISAPPTKDDPYGVGNARAGSFRMERNYAGRFSVGADFLAWNDAWHQEAGVVFYFQDINLGTTDGYSATYSSAYKTLYISQVNDEIATTVGQLADGSVVLDPTHRYRLLASSHDGRTFLFQLFDLQQPENPWMSAIGQDSAYSSGVCGLIIFEQNYPSMTEGVDAVFDNYSASAPAAGAMPATVADLAPAPGGNIAVVYPTVTVRILDRDTKVDPSSIQLSLDGVWLPQSALSIEPLVHKPDNPGSFLQEFSGATLTCAISTLLSKGTVHTNQVAFKDSAGVWQTNTWTWISAYPFLAASNSLPLGSLNVRGFDVRMVQSDNDGSTLENSLARARQQLAIPPLIPLDRTATSIVQILSWDETGTPASVPGLCPGDFINIAVESCAYLELTAGLHRFRIDTDDRSGIYAGLNDPAATNALVLWENPGNTANSTFDFVVEAAGLYPIRCLWEETGGGAHLHLRSVDLNDQSEVLINDEANPAGVVKAWYPIVCLSSPSVTGPYAVAAQAKNIPATVEIAGRDCSPTVVGQMITGGTFTVPINGATQFYCLAGPRETRITSFSRNASAVVISYQMK
jgi:hypothetical protein